jgi:hypothetical protein
MSNGSQLGPLHPTKTRRHRYEYRFYTKHHLAGNSPHAQWHPDLTHDEEFAVFDLADLHDLANQKGNLFGLHIGPSQKPLELGTRGKFVAEFPVAAAGRAWHGYPVYPVTNRGQMRERKTRAPIEALEKMKQAGLLTRAQASRLKKGKAP